MTMINYDGSWEEMEELPAAGGGGHRAGGSPSQATDHLPQLSAHCHLPALDAHVITSLYRRKTVGGYSLLPCRFYSCLAGHPGLQSKTDHRSLDSFPPHSLWSWPSITTSGRAISHQQTACPFYLRCKTCIPKAARQGFPLNVLRDSSESQKTEGRKEGIILRTRSRANSSLHHPLLVAAAVRYFRSVLCFGVSDILHEPVNFGNKLIFDLWYGGHILWICHIVRAMDEKSVRPSRPILGRALEFVKRHSYGVHFYGVHSSLRSSF